MNPIRAYCQVLQDDYCMRFLIFGNSSTTESSPGCIWGENGEVRVSLVYTSSLSKASAKLLLLGTTLLY